MATSIVTLDLTQYVRINVGYTSMILQAHRDEVRIVISESKPALSNTAFMSLGGNDAPLKLDIVDTNVWVLAVSDKSSLIVTESDTSFATEESLSQLVMSITNAINSTIYDLNASPFSETTNIANDYELDNVEFNFSTAESKTITITSADGTLLLNEEDNTDISFVWQPSSELGFNGGENLTVTVTQFTSPGTMDCMLKVKSGTNTLIGNPDVRVVDSVGNVYEDAIRSSCMPTIEIDHFLIHKGVGFTCSDTDTVIASSTKNYLLKNTSSNPVHLREYLFVSTEGDAQLTLFESPTITSNGLPCTTKNNNRASSNTPNFDVFIGAVISADGDQLEHDLLVGGKRSGGSVSPVATEWVLAGNTNYLFKYINNTSQDDDVSFNFYVLEPGQL